MRVYPDTSFLVRLLTEEPATAEAQAEYHRLGRPPMFYLPLHSLEVENALRQRAFYLRHSAPKTDQRVIKRESEMALSLLSKFIARRILVEVAVDLDIAIETARKLSTSHTSRLGCRGFDLLHVAIALELKCEVFLTGDKIQAVLARAEGLECNFPDRG